MATFESRHYLIRQVLSELPSGSVDAIFYDTHDEGVTQFLRVATEAERLLRWPRLMVDTALIDDDDDDDGVASKPLTGLCSHEASAREKSSISGTDPVFSFWNGMEFSNLYRHAAYTTGLQRWLRRYLGFRTAYTKVPLSLRDCDWGKWGQSGLRYWHFHCYLLPMCTLEKKAVTTVTTTGGHGSGSTTTTNTNTNTNTNTTAPHPHSLLTTKNDRRKRKTETMLGDDDDVDNDDDDDDSRQQQQQQQHRATLVRLNSDSSSSSSSSNIHISSKAKGRFLEECDATVVSPSAQIAVTDLPEYMVAAIKCSLAGRPYNTSGIIQSGM